MNTEEVRCPYCGQVLTREDGKYYCPICNKYFEFIDGELKEVASTLS